MTCITQSLATQASPSERSWTASFLKRGWKALWARREQRATVLILRALDDHTLRDIGVDRSEIDSLVYGRPGERRLRYDPR